MHLQRGRTGPRISTSARVNGLATVRPRRRAGVPTAGTLKFRASVLETLVDLDPPEDVDDVDLTASGYDASQDLP